MKVLVNEVEGLNQMVGDMMEKVTGLRLEDKGVETDSRVTKTGGNHRHATWYGLSVSNTAFGLF